VQIAQIFWVILDYDQGRSNGNAFVFPEINADAFFDHTG